jgi:hypothetical protein
MIPQLAETVDQPARFDPRWPPRLHSARPGEIGECKAEAAYRRVVARKRARKRWGAEKVAGTVIGVTAVIP